MAADRPRFHRALFVPMMDIRPQKVEDHSDGDRKRKVDRHQYGFSLEHHSPQAKNFAGSLAHAGPSTFEDSSWPIPGVAKWPSSGRCHRPAPWSTSAIRRRCDRGTHAARRHLDIARSPFTPRAPEERCRLRSWSAGWPKITQSCASSERKAHDSCPPERDHLVNSSSPGPLNSGILGDIPSALRV